MLGKTTGKGAGCQEGDSEPQRWTGRDGQEGAKGEEDIRQRLKRRKLQAFNTSRNKFLM